MSIEPISMSGRHVWKSCVEEPYTVEPQLSEPNGRHTIQSDKRRVRIDEGNLNSRSMGYRVGDN